MFHEWMNGDGTVTRFEVGSKLVSILTAGFELLDGPRAAVAAEIAEDALRYPATDTQPNGTGVTRDQLVTSMRGALNSLREATQDGYVSKEEIANVAPAIIPTLIMLRDYGQTDDEIGFLADLIGFQTMQAFLDVINRAAAGLTALTNQQVSFRQDLQNLRAEFNTYRESHP